jgi:hypothetical protein
VVRCVPDALDPPEVGDEPLLTPEDVAKLELGYHWTVQIAQALDSSPAAAGWRDGVDLDASRPIDVWMVGSLGAVDVLGQRATGSPHFEAIHWHRRRAAEATLALPRGVLVSTTYRTRQEARHTLREAQFLQTLRDARICVSPWGMGERCWRDLQAMALGAVLVRPETGFSETWPDLRAGEHYVACKPDFSDLESVVADVLDDYDAYGEMRARNHALILEHSDLTVQATHLHGIITRAVERGQA